MASLKSPRLNDLASWLRSTDNPWKGNIQFLDVSQNEEEEFAMYYLIPTGHTTGEGPLIQGNIKYLAL